MSVISLQANLAVGYDGGFQWGQQRYELAGISDAGGASQIRLFGPPRWTVSLRSPRAVTTAEAVVWEALLLKARGRVNHVAIHDVNRPAPRGTLRGTPKLLGILPAGSTSAVIVGGTAGTVGTWLAGDPLQFGSGVGTSQLVRVVDDAETVPASSVAAAEWENGSSQVSDWENGSSQVAGWDTSGKITVTFEPPTRTEFAAGTAVTWDKPVAYFKQTSDATSWSYYSNRVQQGFSFDGIEDWTP